MLDVSITFLTTPQHQHTQKIIIPTSHQLYHSIPSSGAAEAPSGSTGCNSPVSELFSKSVICIPSRRPPLALALKGENNLIFFYN